MEEALYLVDDHMYEKLREQVSDVQDYRQYKRSKSSNIVSVIADNTLNFNQFM